MRKLVLRSFKGRKRELRISLVMLMLVFTCGITTLLFQESFYRSKENMRYDTYGEWTGAVYGATESIEQYVEGMKSTEQIGRMVVTGNSWREGKRFGNAGYVDQTAWKLGRLQIKEGTFPADSGEIALTEIAVERMDVPVTIGDTITLALGENEKENNYVVSAIVSSWGSEWKTEEHVLPSVILGADETQQGEVYLFFQNEDFDELNSIETYVELQGEGVYVYNEKAYPLDQSALDEFFQDGKFLYFLVLIGMILICYLMMLTLKSRRYSLTILRGLGADAVEVLEIVLWETLYLWGSSLLVGIGLSILLTGVALSIVHVALEMPIYIKIQWEFILEYISCVSVVYLISNIAVAFTIIVSKIQTSFKADSGLLNGSAPPILKKAEPLTFFGCLKRKWNFYRMIYLGRFVISIIVMVISSICLQHFVEAKNQYDSWMDGMESAYHYYAERPEEGLTEEEIQELQNIEGVQSVEKTVFINCSSMLQDMQEIKVLAPAFQGSEYVDTQRKYSQKMQGIPQTKETGYFSLGELRGISAKDEEQLLYYEKKADIGSIDRERFLAGEECVLFLMPYQLKDLGAGKEVTYIAESEKDSSKNVYTYEMDEHKIMPGDTITVRTPWGEKEVQIGAIITEQKEELPTNAVVLGVSDAFINQVCGFEEPHYMEVKINLDESTDTTRIGERIEGYFETLEQGAGNLTNEAHAVHEFAETSLFEEAQYLFILTTIWLIYMLIMYHGNQIYLKNEGKRIGVLRTLGMDKLAL